jgi:hypothetical protein
MSTDEEQLTPLEQEQLAEALKAYGAPTPEEKHNVHVFLSKVANSEDTTKTGNLDTTELGVTKYSMRTYKNLQLVSDKLCNDDMWAEYFKKKAEILTSTSLSKDGFLTNLAVIQRRQIEEIKKERKENKGWFSKKENKKSEGVE